MDPVLAEVSASLREAEQLIARSRAGTRVHAVALGSAAILRAFREDLESRPRDLASARAALELLRETLAQSGATELQAVPVAVTRS